MEDPSKETMYKVSFDIGNFHYGNVSSEIEAYYFSSETDAAQCALALANQRLDDTRKIAVSGMNLKVLTLRHKSEAEIERARKECSERIRELFPVEFTSTNSTLSPGHASSGTGYEWGGEVESGCRYGVYVHDRAPSVLRCAFDASIIQPAGRSTIW